MNHVLQRRVRCLKSAEEIADYIGESSKMINQLVLDEGLPAWKRNGSGPWRALDIDCDAWLIRQREKYGPNQLNDARKGF